MLRITFGFITNVDGCFSCQKVGIVKLDLLNYSPLKCQSSNSPTFFLTCKYDLTHGFPLLVILKVKHTLSRTYTHSAA